MRFKGLLIVRLGPYFTWLNISGFQSPWDHFWGRNRILKLKFKKSDAPKILRWAKVVWAHPPKNPDVTKNIDFIFGGCGHTTFAYHKIFGASDFLNFNFKMRLWPQKWSHGLWNPEILSHVKYGPNLTIKRPLKRVLKYISAVCLHFYL